MAPDNFPSGREEKELDPDGRETDSSEIDKDIENELDSSEKIGDEMTDFKEILKTTWKSLNPLISEEKIVGNWYYVVYETKHDSQLFIRKITGCILTDSSGPIEPLDVYCLRPQFGSGRLLEGIPAHLPHRTLSSLADIYGLLKVVPLREEGKKV